MRKPDVCPVFLLGGAYGKENLLCAPFLCLKYELCKPTGHREQAIAFGAPFFRKIGAPEKKKFVYAQLVYIMHARRLEAGHEQELFLYIPHKTPQEVYITRTTGRNTNNPRHP